jgi:hypothetical protein
MLQNTGNLSYVKLTVFQLGPVRTKGIVNLLDPADKDPHTLGHTAFKSHVMSSQMP